MSEKESLNFEEPDSTAILSRRELLRRAALVAGGAALATIAAACGAAPNNAGTGSSGGKSSGSKSSSSSSSSTGSSGSSTSKGTSSGTSGNSGSGSTGKTSGGSASGPVKGLMTLSVAQTQAWVRNFNPFSASPLWPTSSAMYEPLMIYNSATSKIVPWLATAYKWSSDNKTLTLTIRNGVKWSDGKPFTAKDVAYTFNLLKKNSGLLGSIAWGEGLASVQAGGDDTVMFKFSKVYTPGLYDIISQRIVPEHVWSKIKDPVKYTNPDPVATGPFTKVAVFRNQIYEIDRNPNYWQKGKPYFQGLRFPAYTGNEQSNQAEINGEVDWFGDYIPNVDKTYVSKDPKHFHFWWPTPGDIYLVLNTTKKPFDDPNVRKGISMALDRERMVKTALYGYTQPANATGLTKYGAKAWLSEQAIAQGKSWVTMDVNKANQMLDSAGLKKGAGGVRMAPDGSRMSYQLIVPSGWTDWIADDQVISNNLRAVGIEAKIKTLSADTWTNNVYTGQFDMSLGWGDSGATPFNFYRGMMSAATYKPVGKTATDNWHRYKNQEATKLLDQFASTSDTNQQKKIMEQLQMIFVKEAPVIPIYGGPDWGEYSTLKFTGFPDKNNAYAPLTPYDGGGCTFIVLTTVKPV